MNLSRLDLRVVGGPAGGTPGEGSAWSVAGRNTVGLAAPYQDRRAVLAFVLFLILVWVILGLVGFVVHGLFWLFLLAVVFFVATLVLGGRYAGRPRSRR